MKEKASTWKENNSQSKLDLRKLRGIVYIAEHNPLRLFNL